MFNQRLFATGSTLWLIVLSIVLGLFVLVSPAFAGNLDAPRIEPEPLAPAATISERVRGDCSDVWWKDCRASKPAKVKTKKTRPEPQPPEQCEPKKDKPKKDKPKKDKSDNSDSNGKGGNKHDRTDKGKGKAKSRR